MGKNIAWMVALGMELQGCVAATVPYYPEPYPGYYGGVAYDYHPYTYYYGYYGAYPIHPDYHRHYNWGYWHGDGHWHGAMAANVPNAAPVVRTARAGRRDYRYYR